MARVSVPSLNVTIPSTATKCHDIQLWRGLTSPQIPHTSPAAFNDTNEEWIPCTQCIRLQQALEEQKEREIMIRAELDEERRRLLLKMAAIEKDWTEEGGGGLSQRSSIVMTIPRLSLGSLAELSMMDTSDPSPPNSRPPTGVRSCFTTPKSSQQSLTGTARRLPPCFDLEDLVCTLHDHDALNVDGWQADLEKEYEVLEEMDCDIRIRAVANDKDGVQRLLIERENAVARCTQKLLARLSLSSEELRWTSEQARQVQDWSDDGIVDSEAIEGVMKHLKCLAQLALRIKRFCEQMRMVMEKFSQSYKESQDTLRQRDQQYEELILFEEASIDMEAELKKRKLRKEVIERIVEVEQRLLDAKSERKEYIDRLVFTEKTIAELSEGDHPELTLYRRPSILLLQDKQENPPVPCEEIPMSPPVPPPPKPTIILTPPPSGGDRFQLLSSIKRGQKLRTTANPENPMETPRTRTRSQKAKSKFGTTRFNTLKRVIQSIRKDVAIREESDEELFDSDSDDEDDWH